MTGTDDGREAYAAERAELARLLPPAPGTDLPPGRHEYHRERLMNLIDDDTARARERADRPARSRLLRPSFLAPATALAVAGALVLGHAAQSGGPAGTGSTGDTRSVSQVLLRISDAAGKGEALPVRDDQFVYTRGTGRDVDLTSGKLVVGPLQESESWFSQKPGPQQKLGLSRVGGETLPINAELGDSEGTRPGLFRPTYRWLSTLPTDPRALLDYLSEITPTFEGDDPDQAVFEAIGGLIGDTLLPPGTAAALYRAAALIPGVTEAPDAVDALGRKGVGIAREDARSAERTEWVFDPDGLSFLGRRSYLTKDTEYGKKGDLLGDSAVIETAVVDTAGVRPRN
ncbi:CU044_5270 family protein [Streptomyces sp. BPSDS2]|uniref:CU044_5270 family protein n=1 Tax=Streptomyces sp. BPSDS2 TaxID=2571021 RepID=UPI0010C02D62|nr:CU044_5270 family protein [Streptomyces sp. BPSDS2]